MPITRAASPAKHKPKHNGSEKETEPAHHAPRQTTATVPPKAPPTTAPKPTKPGVTVVAQIPKPPIASPRGVATMAASAQTKMPSSGRPELMESSPNVAGHLPPP